MSLIDLAEQKKLPDSLIRAGIRRLLKQRLEELRADNLELADDLKRKLLTELKTSPIAIETDAANAQHYEVPAAFFRQVLGSHLKYSACYFEAGQNDLSQAEQCMLASYLERADLNDGQSILELGCGWGSLTLHMATQLPNARIVAVSNSHSQREYILAEATRRGLANVQVLTCDINKLRLDERFDRIVSVEMFEHMRNYGLLFDKIGDWLVPGGKLFVHIFCHRNLMYPFDTEGDDNWMGRHFFTGGLMPAADTLLHFQQRLDIEQQWLVNGKHYAQTAEAWLHNCDRHRADIITLFEQCYGRNQGKLWWQRWRMFFMACAELFAYDEGNEWLVSHYRFSKRGD
jgi:cyclopropane-fatty-acyl-phospholipid synthase